MFSTIRTRLTLPSIRARLTFWYLLTLGVALVGFAVFVWLIRVKTLYRELDAGLEIRAHELAAELQPALVVLDPGVELERDRRVLTTPLAVRVSHGPVLFRSPAFPLVEWAAERDLAEAARAAARSFITVTDRSRQSTRVCTVRIERPGAEPLAIQVAASLSPIHQALQQLGVTMGLAILVVLLTAAYGSGLTTRHALAPVNAIVARVREIQTTGTGERLDVRGGSTELDRLVATLNDMLDRTDASMRSARRFAADASHELQTPLTAMRSVVDAGLRAERSTGEYRTMSGDLLTEIERCSILVRDLRLFALAEAGQLLTAPSAVDVGDVVEECAEIARAIAEPQRIHLDLSVEARPIVRGSAQHLRRVILNLVDNAIRYSPPASTVTLSVNNAQAQAAITVLDHGCGIGADDLPHIFEPFYRADPARARDTGGTGLGLAIADQIVHAHGGQIRVWSTLGTGTTFVVYLPVAA